MSERTQKKTLFSGIKPTGIPTLGSYLGAIKNWTNYVEEYDSVFSIVDLHSITVRIPPEELRENSYTLLAYYIACGLDPDRCILFLQSHVSAHAELAWVLGCYTMFGELGRMTQFKDKSAKNESNINAGLFTYPVLMAADILLYGADIVPVGDDQKQHVEICRDIALRFNSIYGGVFKIPEFTAPKVGARIMSLADPAAKMSKSEGQDQSGCVFLADGDDVILKKFKRAVTDSDACVRYDAEKKPGISNLLEIYAAVTGGTIAAAEREFDGRGYGAFKPAVAEAVIGAVSPIRARANELLADRAYLDSVYEKNAARAEELAAETLSRVYGAVGFIKKPERAVR